VLGTSSAAMSLHCQGALRWTKVIAETAEFAFWSTARLSVMPRTARKSSHAKAISDRKAS
jgi:hypothetical protein